jgi:cell fate regulator YaaT (PSP1 superfamily)
LIDVIGVRFKSSGKIYYFDPNGLKIEPNTDVIVETARGLEYGKAVIGNRLVEEKKVVAPLKKVVRIATTEDREKMLSSQQKEAEAKRICNEKIIERQLPMKLVGVEYSFDGSKVLFYFTAEGRIDFRELVKDLASVFKTRIELRQIGVRDEAKMLGGLGSCGRELCCASFLGDFEPVSIRMAKEQNLSLNPSKISGICGRLMCCLKYESYGYDCKKCKCPKEEIDLNDEEKTELLDAQYMENIDLVIENEEIE